MSGKVVEYALHLILAHLIIVKAKKDSQQFSLDDQFVVIPECRRKSLSVGSRSGRLYRFLGTSVFCQDCFLAGAEEKSR